MTGGEIFLYGFLASLGAGLMTAVGALPLLIGRQPSEKMNDAFLGFAAGIMLAASFFSLIIPSLDVSGELYGEGVIPALIAVGGILLGAYAVRLVNDHAPHEHFITGHEGPKAESLRRIWLFVIAISIHNFPEGLAVGVGFGSGEVSKGLSLAVGIGLQNAPEGLAVAVALIAEGYKRTFAVGVAALTGLIEPIAGAIGAGAVTLAQPILPWGLAFAGGAMIYVISSEIIPETHRHGHERAATTGFIIGLVIMLFLDVTLG